MADKKLHYSLLLFAILCLLCPGHGMARKFSVNSLYDGSDLDPGDGLCVSYIVVFPPFVIPFCTLRAAIEETNSLPGDDEIVLSSVTYALDVHGAGEDGSATGDLDITESVTISGKGRGATIIDGGELDRIFDIHGAGTRVKIHDLTLQNGRVVSYTGGIDMGGGAIRNYGMLTLADVALTENHVQGGGSGNTGGGALYNQGDCSLLGSSVFFNGARAGGAVWNGTDAAMHVEQTTLRHNFSDLGGGMYNQGTLSLVNSTVSNNGMNDASSKVSGIYNSGVMDIIQSTIAENNGGGRGVGLLNEGEITFINSLITSHDRQNCVLPAPLTSSGGNLDGDGSCNMEHETDLSGTDPLLSPLRANGGLTWTHVFLLGSPLRDGGLDLSGRGVFVDQRGRARPRGKGYDIGAVERQFSAIVPALGLLLLRKGGE